MATHGQVFEAWVNRALGKEKRSRLKGTNVSFEHDMIYSYHWWPLGRIIRDKNGKPRMLWLNGDQYSSSTTGHQNGLRHTAQEQKKLPVLIVPESSMLAAGIDMESIRPIEIKPDGWESIHHQRDEMPVGAQFIQCWSEPVIEREEYDECPAGFPTAKRERFWSHKDSKHVERFVRYVKKDPQTSHFMLGFPLNHYQYGSDQVRVEPIMGSVFNQRPTSQTKYVLPIQEYEGVFHWTERRHMLGDSVFRAKVKERIPSTKAWCVPCKGTGVGDSGSFDWRRRRCSKCEGTGRLLTKKTRWATFVSSFDRQEPGRFYFLCELPYGKIPESFDQAIEMLKPEAVRMAELSNRHVVRQGDIFFIETPITDQYVKDNAEKVGKTKELRLLSQNHSATRVAYMPDGLQLAKGRVYHIPGEHRVQELGDRTKWYAVCKNTVPIRKA
jgi:hypothetical protein